jgi:formate dehydrogenase subunit delta
LECIYNANRVALNFSSFPREEAITRVLEHIQKFWEPRMKQQLIDHVASGGSGLHELVLEAVKRLPVDA